MSTPGDVRGRRRAAADLPGCIRALEAVHAADGYPAWWPADPAGWLSPPGSAEAWIAVRPGAVLGHVRVVRGEPGRPDAGTRGGRPLLVSRLFVTPPARGTGLGEALLLEAGSWATARGGSLALDVVEDSRPAVALYERLGWRLVDRRPADWSMPDDSRPHSLFHRAPGS